MVYLQITLNVDHGNRKAAAEVFNTYKAPFLDTVRGAVSKELLARDEDVQVLHGFETIEHAHEYLESDLFNADVVTALAPLLTNDPEVRIYCVAE
ncbi:hypothetical protein AN391_00070 [Pseudoalteromonas sp. P1-13-1a]|uniref:Uncharacterized protein n=1 Tax=Pseudoalteromonas undina TaxID=43660 RepID=A0ACC6R0I4_9GAMM|nr:hypothetical protein [Pseudoalteromonas sp. P1-13-1a]KPZ60458.1 hypothetical protein AN391_00070 [Pseudoalteromonas sp. P1-13-1a]